jgi:hypothetical protein
MAGHKRLQLLFDAIQIRLALKLRSDLTVTVN